MMKLKLNDPKEITSYYHSNELFQQNRDINSWLYKLGLSRHKIESHTQLADIRLLLDLQEHKTQFTAKDTQIFDKIWKNVYINEYPLTQYYKTQLINIVNGIEFRRKQIVQKRNSCLHYEQRRAKRNQAAEL